MKSAGLNTSTEWSNVWCYQKKSSLEIRDLIFSHSFLVGGPKCCGIRMVFWCLILSIRLSIDCVFLVYIVNPAEAPKMITPKEIWRAVGAYSSFLSEDPDAMMSWSINLYIFLDRAHCEGSWLMEESVRPSFEDGEREVRTNGSLRKHLALRSVQ